LKEEEVLARHVAGMRRERNAQSFFGGEGAHLKERDYTEELCVDGRVILKWILKK